MATTSQAIHWKTDFEAARRDAGKGRPVLLDFSAAPM